MAEACALDDHQELIDLLSVFLIVHEAARPRLRKAPPGAEINGFLQSTIQK